MATKKSTAPDVALQAVEPIRIDGEDIAPGEGFTASAKEAEALLASGAAVTAEPAPV